MENFEQLKIITKANIKLNELKVLKEIRIDDLELKIQKILDDDVSLDVKEYYIQRLEFIKNKDKEYINDLNNIIDDLEKIIKDLISIT